MKLHALSVYVSSEISVESAIDKIIDCGYGSDIIAVTRSMKRTYVHLKSLATKQHLLTKGFFDPVESVPLVVTAQGIPIELDKNDVFNIFKSWGEVTKTIATTKTYRNIRYRNGNWQIHFKRFYKEFQNHISASSEALKEKIYITTKFDKAEMIKRVIPTKPSQNQPPLPPSQPQRSGEEKTKYQDTKQPPNKAKSSGVQASNQQKEQSDGKSNKYYSPKTRREESLLYADIVSLHDLDMDIEEEQDADSLNKSSRPITNIVQMDIEVNPTQVIRKTPEEGHSQPNPKKSKTTTKPVQESMAQSAAHQTSNPEVPVRTPFGTKNQEQTKSSGESRKTPSKAIFTVTDQKGKNIYNDFSKYVKKRKVYLDTHKPSSLLKHGLSLKDYNYGHVAWSFFLNTDEWATLMLRYIELRNDTELPDPNYTHFVDGYCRYNDDAPEGFINLNSAREQVDFLINLALHRWEQYKQTKTCKEPSFENWAILRYNREIYFK